MFRHHLKIAFRNLRKYKTQNIISIIGLAVGFTCFAFSTLWIRYEMNYDNFHPNADRIYRVHIVPFKWNTTSGLGHVYHPPFPLGNWLEANIPEIEAGASIRVGGSATANDYPLYYVSYDFCKIFDFPLPEEFFIPGLYQAAPIAVVPEIHNEVVAKTIKEQYNWDVLTTIPRHPPNTVVMKFDIAVPVIYHANAARIMNNWRDRMSDVYVLVRKGIDMKALKEKLDKIEIPEHESPVSIMLTPIKEMRYKDPMSDRVHEIQFNHVRIFSLAGLLVILCSLLNHFILYVTHTRMRLRELAIRKVNGASDLQIAVTLYTDFLLVILLSLIIGFMLMAWLLPTFKEFAEIESASLRIYVELIVYAVFLIVCGFIVCGIPILYFRKQIMNDNIKGFGGPRNLFHKSSLFVQLIISLGMMFCTAVYIKQIRFLHHTDLGINRSNVVLISANCCPLPPHYANQIKQIPGIVDAFSIVNMANFKTLSNIKYTQVYEKDGQPSYFEFYRVMTDAHYFDFFGMEIIEGMSFDNTYNQELDWTGQKMVVNETAIKEIGKELLMQHFDVIGIVREIHLTPTTRPLPTLFIPQDPEYISMYRYWSVVYRYEKGMRLQTEQAVSQWFRNEYSDQGEFEIELAYMEDVFEENFKSERALLTLLSVMTIACILIAIFGVHSLTSLTCEQRRKEIAIRKINGAEVLDIMNIFFMEYLILLALAAFVAFPAGYIIMKRWLEGYVKQTAIDAWLYVLIFLIVFVVIVFSIFSTVWKAANRNPAEVVKSE